MCQVCYVQPIKVALLYCGHRMCNQCADTIITMKVMAHIEMTQHIHEEDRPPQPPPDCPFCRKPFHDTLNLY